MADLSSCLAIVDGMSNRDADYLLERVDLYLGAGIAPKDAQRMAAKDLLAEVEADQREARDAIRAQHPELFRREASAATAAAPAAKPRRYFESQAEATTEPAEAVMLSRPAQTETQAFRRWFGASKIVDDDGRPRVMYHGTAQDIEAFVPKQAGAIFVTDEPIFAQAYADTSAKWMESRGQEGATNIVPLYVKAERPFDYEDAQQVAAVKAKLDDAGNWQTLELIDGGGLAEPDNWHLIETDPMQEAIKALGHDGFFVSEGGFKNLAVYKPEQLKSAVGNGGTFDPTNPDLRLSRALGGRFVLPPFGRTAQLIEQQQDSENRLKQVVRAVRQQGGIVSEAGDFYLTEERRISKTAARLEDFKRGDVRELVREVASEGLTLDELVTYAMAKHAPERNEYLQERRSDGADGMSGMTTVEALAIRQEAREAGLEPALERLHARLMRITKGTRDFALAEGLIDDATHARLAGMFDFYVPFRGIEGEAAAASARSPSKGNAGRNFLGPRMLGRRSQATMVLERIIHDRAVAIIQAGYNEVGRSFGQFVLDNPDPSLWELEAVETRPVMTVGEDGGPLIEERERKVTDEKRTVTFLDGGKRVSVLVKDDVMRSQLKGLGIEHIGPYLDLMRVANRNLGRLYTGLNLAFAVKNFVRDLGTAAPSMIDSVGFTGAAKLYGFMPRALLDSFLAEIGKPPPEFQIWRAAGGKTGYLDLTSVERVAAELRHVFADAQRLPVDPRKWLPKVFELIESVSAVFENATRFASYLAARSEGKTVAEGISISKNVTVNFTRRGTKTAHMSAWFLFYNPAVQGTARILEALKSPKVLATLGAGMTGVVLLALQNASAGDDDDGVPWWDKIPQDVKDRNLIVMLPPILADRLKDSSEAVPGSKIGRYVKVPMPYGWNWFATVANQSVDLWRHGQDPAHGVKPTQAMKNVVTAFLNAFSPVPDVARSVDSPKSLALLAVPDFLDPIAQVLGNVNAFGKPLHPEYPNQRSMPDSEKAFTGQVGTAYHRAARALNAATGGSKYGSGLLDLSPGAIENLVRAYGGGPVTFSLDILNTMYARQSIERPEAELRRAPILRDFYARIDDETDRALAYQRMDLVRSVVEPLQKAIDAGDEKEALALFEKSPGIAGLGDALKLTQKLLSEVRKQEIEILESNESDGAKYAKLLVASASRRKILQQLNKEFDKAARFEAAGKTEWEVETK